MSVLKSRPPAYPFGAIVGQQSTKQALLLNAVSPSVGGVLIQGEKGTAKSTAVRALAGMMPPIPVVPGCPSLCDPAVPFEWCPACKGVPWTGAPAYAPAPFVDVPISAGEDRLIGHMDAEAAMAEGRFAFRPGLLAKAHRGILYVDEINLLPDHLVDALLDAAASGWNRVERDGFSVAHPARFVLVGTMNPEEGELRPQLLDRFGLSVHVSTPADVAERALIMSRRMEYEADPAVFAAAWEADERQERERLQAARDAFARVALSYERLEQVARLCLAAKTEGMRADLAICETAKALAAYRRRPEVTAKDVNDAASLALRHRSTAPWQPEPEPDPEPDPDPEPEIDPEPELNSEPPKGGPEDGSGANRGGENNADRPSEDRSGRRSSPTSGAAASPAPSAGSSELAEADGKPSPRGPLPPSRSPGTIPEQLLPIDSAYRLNASLLGDSPHRETGSARRSSKARMNSRRGTSVAPPHAIGRHIRSRPLHSGSVGDAPVDWPRTIQAAALRRSLGDGREGASRIRRADVREKVIVGSYRQLLLFAVDASGSMAGYQRMEQTKAAVLSLIEKAYQDRNSFALLCFRDARAELVLPPTRSVGLARLTLERLASGGGTPLALGLRTCAELLERWHTKHPELRPNVYLLTDGRVHRRGAASADNSYEAAVEAARSLAERECPVTVIDTETGTVRLGLARRLAAAMQATRYATLQELAK
ncbi:ATP-binding protein [Paenibacillus sp. TRM 82003]|nr:ATP-binding protein [Paenibacillus sp. TRM 82003]